MSCADSIGLTNPASIPQAYGKRPCSHRWEFGESQTIALHTMSVPLSVSERLGSIVVRLYDAILLSRGKGVRDEGFPIWGKIHVFWMNGFPPLAYFT